MATTSPMLSLPLPTSTDADQVPADLLTLSTAAEKFMVGRFPSAAARTALIPAPDRGMVSWVNADGYPTYHDGSIWRPFSGQRIGQILKPGTTAALVAAAGSQFGFTDVLTLPSVPFPTQVSVTYSAFVQHAVLTEQTDVGLFRNGSMLTRQRMSGLNSGGGVFDFDVAASTSVTLQGILTKAVGGGDATSPNDASLCYLQAVVTAQ